MTMDATKWAEDLIKQLPETHEGRNSWLLNHGTSAEAIAIRRRDGRGIPDPKPAFTPYVPGGAAEMHHLMLEALRRVNDADLSLAVHNYVTCVVDGNKDLTHQREALKARVDEVLRANNELVFARQASNYRVLKVRELRNRLYDEGKTDVAALIDEALGDNPASPVSANEQKVLGEKLEAASMKISQLEAAGIMPAVMAILDERKRQIAREGWTPAHDDEHTHGQLAAAAACYAMEACRTNNSGEPPVYAPDHWPFDAEWWKPDTAQRMLEKAGALIIAELERLARL